MAGCSGPTPWHLEAISAIDPSFSSSRLIYSTPSSHLKMELLRVGESVDAFLFLNQHTLEPAPEDSQSTLVNLKIDGMEIQEFAPLRQGRMKLRLSRDATERIIFALQEGKKVGILVSGLSETIEPESFRRIYSEFLKGQGVFSNILKGPLE